MKKSLIALAVAGVVSAPAFAATANVDVYGQMMFSVDHVDNDDPAGDSSDIVTGQDNASRFGIKGSEDLGGGLKAIWQIESQTQGSGQGALGSRNTFVGLSGGFGTVVLGKHDTPYKLATGALDIWGDSSADYNNIISRNAAGTNNFDLRAGATVAYISPTFAGFHAAAAYVEAKNVEAAGVDNLDALSVMGMYKNGPLFASLAYETHSGGVGTSTGADEEDAWKVGLGYTFGNAKIGAVYESVDNDAANSANSRDAWYINGAYTMGNIVLKASYSEADESDANNNDGADSWTIGADYMLSKRTTVFAFYNTIDNDTNAAYRTNWNAAVMGKELDTFSLGVKHTF